MVSSFISLSALIASSAFSAGLRETRVAFPLPYLKYAITVLMLGRNEARSFPRIYVPARQILNGVAGLKAIVLPTLFWSVLIHSHVTPHLLHLNSALCPKTMLIKGNFCFAHTSSVHSRGFASSATRVCVHGQLFARLFIYLLHGRRGGTGTSMPGAWSYSQTRARPSSLQTPAPARYLLPPLRRAASPHASVYAACSKSQTFLSALPPLRDSHDVSPLGCSPHFSFLPPCL